VRYEMWSNDLKGITLSDCTLKDYLHYKQYILSKTSTMYGAKLVATKRVISGMSFNLTLFMLIIAVEFAFIHPEVKANDCTD